MEPFGFVAASAGAQLFKYNRKGYQWDQQMRMKRNFKTFNFRVGRYSMYREDVRDLVELTVGKMDLYMVFIVVVVVGVVVAVVVDIVDIIVIVDIVDVVDVVYVQ